MNDDKLEHYVYLIEDIVGNPFYVGIGKGDRMYHHTRRAFQLVKQYPRNAKCLYVADCISRGFTPEPYKVAENLTAENAAEIEIALIKQIGRRDLGKGPLLNACDGGHGVKNFSDETKALIAERTRDAMASIDIRQKLSLGGKRRFQSESERLRTAELTRAQWASEEGRSKFAAKAKTRWTPELRARQAELTRKQLATAGNPMLGRKQSAESRAKMSASAQKFWDAEARARQAARMQGKKLSDETRAKMRASHRARLLSGARTEA